VWLTPEKARSFVVATWLLIAIGVFCEAPPDATHSDLAWADASSLAAILDRKLVEYWAAEGLQPAPQAEDSVFVRRLYLDLAGHIPPIYEVRDFLDDRSGDKRLVLIERLLRSPNLRGISPMYGAVFCCI
jgi:hypothetical protein